MANPLLCRAKPARVVERLAAVIEHVQKEALIGPRQLVAGLLGAALRKRRFRAEPALDIAPPPLDEVRDEGFAIERLCRIAIEISIQQAEQRAKTLLYAAMRSRRHEQDVTVGIGGEIPQPFIALVLDSRGSPARPRRGVRLVDDDEVRRGGEETGALRS
jgi:hypothetical protein